MEILTKNNNNFYNMSSLMQKAIRRGDYFLAAKAAGDIFTIFPNYAQNRLPIIFTEDCDGLMGQILLPQIEQLHENSKKLKKANEEMKINILNDSLSIINNLIYLLAKNPKNRDVDLFLKFQIKTEVELLKFKNIDTFNNIEEFYNYLYKIIMQNTNDPKILGKCFYLMYTSLSSSKENNLLIMQKFNHILNFIIKNNKIKLNKEERDEIYAYNFIEYLI